MDWVTAGRRVGRSSLAGVAHTGADLGPRSKAQQISRSVALCCSFSPLGPGPPTAATASSRALGLAGRDLPGGGPLQPRVF